MAAPSYALDREALRKLVPLPKVAIQFSFEFGGSDSPDISDDAARHELEAKPDASTVEALARRGELLSQLKRYDEARAVYAQEAAAWRKQVAARPKDDALLVSLGWALNASKQYDEAQATMRRAVALAPRSGKAWTALGSVLSDAATHLVFPEGVSMSVRGISVQQTEGAAGALQKRPSPESIARARALVDEARAAYDHAVEVEPHDPDAYSARIGFRMDGESTSAAVDTLQADASVTLGTAMSNALQGAMQKTFSPAAVLDLRQVARLKPNDVQALGAAALVEISSVAARESAAGRDSEFTKIWPLLPQDARDSVRFSMGRLQVLAQSDTPAGGEASEALGGLQFMTGEAEAAQASLRRAIKLAPAREQAWGLLANIFREANRFDEMAALLQDHLRTSDTAANRLALAKALDKAGQAQRVPEQVDAALKIAPDDITANMARVALLLRAGEDSLGPADKQLTRVGALLAAPASPSNTQTEDYALLRGVYQALIGNASDARRQMQIILDADGDNESARQVLALLDDNQAPAAANPAAPALPPRILP